jgi:type I restriction enzyme S subunit
MKEMWQFKTLNQISTNLDSRRVPITKGVRVGGEYPYFGASGIVDYVADYIFDEDTLLISEDGANLLARSTPIAFPASGKYWVNNHAHILKFESQTTQRFVELYLESIPLDEYITGAAQPKLNQKALNSIPIPFPPQSEQRRIVGILDEAFEGLATAKANAEKNLQNARALFESHLQSVFTQRGPGWMETTLESCCEQIFAGGDVPKDRFSEERTPNFNVPIYSNGEKRDGLYGFTDVARVMKPSITVSARGTLGFTVIRTEPFLPVVRLIVLVPDESQIMLSFLYYAVVGMNFGNTGTSIPQLTVPNFKESKLHVPSLSEQASIVKKLDALTEETQRLAHIYERKLAALDELKKSLLHQAFTGEL